MLVLLHFYQLGYTPFTLAMLFLLYEVVGIFANLGGGWLASRFGIPRMLAIGLGLQIAGLLMLSALNPNWGAAASVAWVVAAQGVAGIAKDITKTAAKSAIKASSAGGSGQLFRWVAWFTGSKNAVKGAGLFVGGGGGAGTGIGRGRVRAAGKSRSRQIIQKLSRVVCQDPGDQPACRRPICWSWSGWACLALSSR